MKQVLQSLKNGAVELADVPAPMASRGKLLIQNRVSLISSGTERMLLDFGRANLINKALQQPERVRQAVDKLVTDGFFSTYDASKKKLDKPVPLGYCSAGVVKDSGGGSRFKNGDRVVTNGYHAEVILSPFNLCAKIPDSVTDEEASFTVLAAVGLQGIRLANPTLGETVAVIGLGLVGLLTIQMLRANGCKVIGFDRNQKRVALAKTFNVEAHELNEIIDPVQLCQNFSDGHGVDAVIITTATNEDGPIRLAEKISRKKGRIVVVGTVGMQLSRTAFFEKELSFQVSCSYGPGRYDKSYELDGNDYPIGYIRWTEQRNFEAVLDMMSAGTLNVRPLVSHQFNIDDVYEAYALLDKKMESLGLLLKYPTDTEASFSTVLQTHDKQTKSLNGYPTIGFLGAGSYATNFLMPAFQKFGAKFTCLYSATGTNGAYAAKKFSFNKLATDFREVIYDGTVDLIAIATRHDTHANFLIEALKAGKNIFLEKPLCINRKDLDEIKRYAEDCGSEGGEVLVGFNRRFSPFVQKAKQLLDLESGPKVFIYNINAGSMPKEHWASDPEIGGGRVIGEVCHFVDLLRYLAGSRVSAHHKVYMDGPDRDTLSLQLYFQNGSIGTINYYSNGPKLLPKERIEILSGGKALIINNFRKMDGYSWPGFKSMRTWRQDKGQDSMVKAFINNLKIDNSSPLIPFEQLLEVAEICIDISNAS